MAWFHNGKKYWYHNGKRHSRSIRMTKRRGFFKKNNQNKWIQVGYFSYLESKLNNNPVKSHLLYENEKTEYFDDQMYNEGKFNENDWDVDKQEFNWD